MADSTLVVSMGQPGECGELRCVILLNKQLWFKTIKREANLIATVSGGSIIDSKFPSCDCVIGGKQLMK